MALVVPTPRDVVGAARSTTAWAWQLAEAVLTLPVRTLAVLTDVEALVDRVGVVAAEAELAVARVGAVLDAATVTLEQAAAVVGRASLVVEGADAVVARSGSTVDGAAGVIAGAERTVVGAAGVIAGAERTVVGAAGVIAGAEQTVVGAAGVIAGAERTVVGAAGVIAGAERTVVGAAGVIAGAERTVTEAARTIADAAVATRAVLELLERWQPIAEQARPLAARFVAELSDTEVAAAIHVVDQLPAFSKHLSEDVLPLLETLDKAGPDIHELLDVAKDAREAVAGIPGFTFLRRRGEHKLD